MRKGSWDMGKMSVYDKILIENLKERTYGKRRYFT